MADGAVVSLELEPGLFTGMLSESSSQKLGEVRLSAERPGWHNEGGLPFTHLSPIALSELLRDLESLRP
jgi:hypothetical protein